MLLLSFFALLAVSNGARILGIIPTPSFSHQIAFWPIWKQLSLRGHKVTTVTTDPMFNSKLTNLTEINIKEGYNIIGEVFESLKTVDNPLLVNKVLRQGFLRISKLILDIKDIASLTKNETSFDLVMVEAHFPEFLIYGSIYGCPTVLLSSLDAINEVHGPMGNSINPVTNPDLLLPYFRDLDFQARLISTVYVCLEWILGYPQYMSDRHKVLREYFGDDAPDVQQMLDNVAMLFVNTHPALHGFRSMGPNTVQFGGMVHMRDPQPLPRDLQTFLDSSVEGVVYFSLGTNMLSKDLKSKEFDVISQALSELPYKVLWKYELDDIPHKPGNIKFAKWLPQQDVLRHPNIRAFVTQGGLQSLEEAIYYHVPVVVLPFAADQEQNAKKVEFRNIGKAIYHKLTGLDKDQLKDAIIQVITDPSYRKNTEDLAKIILDEPMTGVEKVIWWTEYIIRHKGAKHFRNPNLDVPLYQYLMLDILVFFIVILVILVLILVLVYKITRRLFSLAIRCVKHKTE
ncbi:unnamed protein product [Callosobruchus maculatus]|uniref:UDP-glucuronosyltransferase n=1 Tax=Callosobruchus maculatus TaxID=64391 RepID=A0A653CX56_CALMS|nr:unnamed protein product [Callosobruchus maculatus]